MAFLYQSGGEVKLRDRVRLHGQPAEIGSIHDAKENPKDWFVERYGGGVMVVEPKVPGRLFIKAPVSDYEDLEFVSRGLRPREDDLLGAREEVVTLAGRNE